jgi:hypothetical protein
MAKKRGQPTAYREAYCQLLIDHMSQGLSFETFGAIVDVCKDTTYEWVKVHPEFSEAKKLGSIKRNLLVEKRYIEQTQLPASKANSAMMIYWTKNTLGWTDKVEVDSSVTQTQRLVIEEPKDQ